ncbi:MAG: hypothetical protein IT314_16045 [Anaerolineales bacterium]|nr:hypothetical protein [Anaerolineales bacterium]
MRPKRSLLIVLLLVYSLLAACTNELADSAPTVTATPTEKPKPTVTPTRTPQALAANATPTAAAPLPVPSPFDIALLFTNGSCGTGTPTWYYTFTIDGTSLTQVQTDGIGGPVVVSLAGTYDPVSGAFSTSADVGTGVENHEGTIAFDGTTITVTGVYGYTPTGGATCTFDFEGTATP